MADIGASNWNETDDSNSSVAPDGAPEGMLPSGLNNTIRAMMGATKRWYDWTIPKITGGLSTVYTLTYSVAPGALVDGMTHLVQFHAANGNAATLNVNSLGAIPLQYYSAGAWRPIPANLFDINTISRVTYNTGAGAYRLLDVTGDTGEVKPFAGITAPAGYLFCFGQAISRTAYAGLFAVLGTQYGAGDGSTTFNLPDLRGRVAAGKDDMGGSAANRITGTTIPNSPILGAAGGAETESTNISGTASGSVAGVTDFASGGTFLDGGGSNSVTGLSHNHFFSVAASLSVAGSTVAVTNVQPTIILNQMIRI